MRATTPTTPREALLRFLVVSLQRLQQLADEGVEGAASSAETARALLSALHVRATDTMAAIARGARAEIERAGIAPVSLQQVEAPRGPLDVVARWLAPLRTPGHRRAKILIAFSVLLLILTVLARFWPHH